MTPPGFWATPPRTLLGAIERQARDAQGRERITVEVVQAVRATGRAVVLGVELPTAGPARLQAGQFVHVAWREGRPVAILATAVRRAQFADLPTSAAVATGLVEELFLAPFDPHTPGSALDVWFRNDRQVVCLNMRSFISGTPEYVKWGIDGTAFFVRSQSTRYTVFSVARTADVPIGSAAPVVTLVGAQEALSGMTIASVVRQVTMTGTLYYATASVTVVNPPPDPFDPITAYTVDSFSPGPDLTLAGAVDRTTTITLGPPWSTFIEGGYGVYIDDVHLNERRELVAIVRVNLGECLARDPLVLNNVIVGQQVYPITPRFGHFPFGLFDQYNYLPSEVAPRDVKLSDPGFDSLIAFVSPGEWPVLVNLTQHTVLWTPLASPVVLSCTSNHAIPQAGPSDYTEPDVRPVGAVFLTRTFIDNEPDVGGTFVTQWVAYNGDPLPFPIGRLGREDVTSGIIAIGASIVDHSKLPFIGAESTWAGINSTGPTFISGALNVDAQLGTVNRLWVDFNRTTKSFGQNLTFAATAKYVPRRGTGVGQILVGVRTNTGTGVLRGLFLLDVDAASTATILPYVSAQAEFSPKPNPGPMDPYVIGADLHRALWFNGYFPAGGPRYVKEVMLTGYAPSLHTKDVGFSDSVTGAILINIMEQAFQVLRPDFMYYASDTAAAGNQFLLDHNVVGDLLLDKSASGYPQVDPQLQAFGALLALPAGVTPKPQQIVAGQELLPGPSYLVVNDSTRWTPVNRFIADPPG